MFNRFTDRLHLKERIYDNTKYSYIESTTQKSLLDTIQDLEIWAAENVPNRKVFYDFQHKMVKLELDSDF